MSRVRAVLAVGLGALALIAVACTTPPGGGGGTTTTTTTSLPDAPVAIASASPTIGDAPLTVNFDSTGSSPGTGTGLTYSWDFGDGSPLASGPTATHVYETVGIFTARLTMTSTAGTSVSPGILITANLDPNPKFYVRPTGGLGPDCGPKLNPCSNINVAQANAVAAGIRILHVAGGNYPDPVNLASNMSIIGGFTQDFTDFGPGEITTISGNGTTPPVTINGRVNSSISGVSIQGATRTSGSAVGVVVGGASTGIQIGDVDSPLTVISGGVGPNATGVLVQDGASVAIESATVNSGTPVGAGSSAYGIRVLQSSVANVTLTTVTAQPGVAGTSAPGGTPGQAASGCGGGNGGNAGGPSDPGGGGGGGGCSTYGGGSGGRGGDYSGSGDNGAGGAGPGAGGGGGGGCGSLFGCGDNAGGGGAGTRGNAGSPGAAGTAPLVANDLYTPTNGTAGTPGAHGSGGGGGGGGKSASASGGGGGGGGAGGNGGAAGTVAGTSGGGSFAVYANNASVNFLNSEATSSAGGVGGSGANAGRGGNGGNGGNGGSDSCCLAGGGGGGGGGAPGGGGGGAGGGAGGPSISVFHVGTGSLVTTGSAFNRPVFPASGGAGGAAASAANPGIGGAGNDGSAGGASSSVGLVGPAGASGPNGPLFRVWNNGTITN